MSGTIWMSSSRFALVLPIDRPLVIWLMAYSYYREEVVKTCQDSVGSKLTGLEMEETVNLRVVPAGKPNELVVFGDTMMNRDPLFTEQES